MDTNNNQPPTEGYQATPAYQPPPAANTNPPPQSNPYAAPPPQSGYSSQQNPYAAPQPNTNKPQYTANSATDTSNDKLYGILSYIGPLFLVGLIAAPNSKFAKYHANQGLVLFLAEIIWGAISGTLSAIFNAMGLGLFGSLLGLVSLVFFVLMVLGIINANAMKEEPLPVIGGITILK